MYLYTIFMVLIFGIVIGSFLNVCILRLPNHENITTERSHCNSCGSVLKWYELIPVLSYLALRGKCRTCHSKISIQYPIIELLNGILYCMVIIIMGMNVRAILMCALTSCLVVIAVIDWRIYEIPVGLNVFIGIIGIINLIFDYKNWAEYVIGALVVSVFLIILFVASKGRAIGGGDIKLMFASGLFLGWQRVILAFVLGCVIGSVIHIIRMKVSGKNHILAFGPYLAIGIWIAGLFGERIIRWYLSMAGL